VNDRRASEAGAQPRNFCPVDSPIPHLILIRSRVNLGLLGLDGDSDMLALDSTEAQAPRQLIPPMNRASAPKKDRYLWL
jgi:hypothetical protein